MMNILNFYEAGKARNGSALIPYFDTLNVVNLLFSTRTGNAVVKWGDGQETELTTLKNHDTTSNTIGGITKAYSSAFTGSLQIVFAKGLRDVYSLYLQGQGSPTSSQTNKYNILDFGLWIKQFSNLYSFHIQIYDYGMIANRGSIKGNLVDVPDSVERILIGDVIVVNPTTDIYVNFNAITGTSKLKSFTRNLNNVGSNFLKISGSISDLPASLEYIKISGTAAGSLMTYTPGKIWASSFDTFDISYLFSTNINNSILADMNNSISTSKGGKIISLQGLRTAISDSAFSELQAKGFTVSCPKLSDTTLTMSLSANLLDASSYLNHATMVGLANYTGGALNISAGNYAYIPSNTSLDFGIGSLYFGCKVKFNAVSGLKGIIGKTLAGSVTGRYGIYLNSNAINAICQLSPTLATTNTVSAADYNDGQFHSIDVICNRTTGKQSLYIDGVLINTVSFTPSNDNITINARFAIGAYNNSTGNALQSGSELSGAIKDVFVHKF